MQHLEKESLEKKVAVDGKLRQRHHLGVGRDLPGDAVVPVEDSDLEVLLQPDSHELHIASMLMREEVIAEINMVLEIFDINRGASTRPRQLNAAAELHGADLTEIVVPDEVVGDIMFGNPVGRSVVETSVSLDSHSVAEERDVGKDLAVEFEIASGVAGKAKPTSALYRRIAPCDFSMRPPMKRKF